MPDTPQINAPPKPLTVEEIAAFPRPNFVGAGGLAVKEKLTRDTNGGFSFRWKDSGFSYIAIPLNWEGRTLPQGTQAMGEFLPTGVNITEVHRQYPNTIVANLPGNPPDSELLKAAVAVDGKQPESPDPSPLAGYESHILIAAIVASVVIVAFAGALVVVGGISVWRRNRGTD